MKISKSREKYLLEIFFGTTRKKDIPEHLSQFGFRDFETSDEDLFFITQYILSIDRLILGGSLITENGLNFLKKLKNVKELDLRSLPLDDNNLDSILHFENLEYLYIKFTNITSKGISTILRSFPKLRILVAEIKESETHLIALWEKEYPEVELNISYQNS